MIFFYVPSISKKMNILFLTRSLESGGAERQLIVLACGLAEHGHDVIVAEFYGGGLLERELRTSDVRLIDLKKQGRWSNLFFFIRLIRLVLRERPNIIHGYLGVPNILAIFLRLFCPSTRVVWGIRASDMDLSRYDWLSRLCYRLECFFSSRADLIIANSFAGRAFAVKNGFPANKMMVIPNGIDTERFQPDRVAGLAIRRSWPLPDGVPLIGIVGRIDPMKDYENFLHAAKRVYTKQPDVYFVCVGRGEGAELTRLKQLAAKLGIGDSVIWAGERQDLKAVYNSFDLLCLSSVTESFPNVVAEAMACGIPCVVTDVGDAAQIIGKTGRVVPPQDSSALGDALLSMLKEHRDLPDEAVRQRISELFSVERLIVNTEIALEKLLAKSTA